MSGRGTATRCTTTADRWSDPVGLILAFGAGNPDRAHLLVLDVPADVRAIDPVGVDRVWAALTRCRPGDDTSVCDLLRGCHRSISALWAGMGVEWSAQPDPGDRLDELALLVGEVGEQRVAEQVDGGA
ncbi:hypothetical protein Misp04_39400 [Micromonospora sp. NBRC 101691]|nr:hypothetical protein Misp04_39400 [Micromonospora sp. NBRC 101691]